MHNPPDTESNLAHQLRAAITKIARSDVTYIDIETALHALIVTGGDTTKRDYPRRLKPADAETTRQELRSVVDAAESLLTALNSLHAPAAALMEPLEHKLTTIRVLSAIAKMHADGPIEPIILPEHPSPKEALAQAAAMVFVKLTGNVPTRVTKRIAITTGTESAIASGPFVDFLKDVFAARGIVVGHENCAKAAIEVMESHRAK